ncbi:hypothetical protein GCM10010174_68120 [Kutzneria viridogrisea]|uniref:Acyl carrier protein n=1 Tax=Kutzneria viridogrisea TaxID=47990 RepID=A0ABR6B956_9PSEU|nr:acyl carrier protein [Kutzneria viridogrisea]
MDGRAALTEAAVRDRLSSCLAELLLMERVPDDFDLISNGSLNSSMFLALLVELEDRFDIQISGTDMNPENFQTLDRMTQFVCAKRTES